MNKLIDKARYYFDSSISRGLKGLIVWLFLVSVTVSLLLALFTYSLGVPEISQDPVFSIVDVLVTPFFGTAWNVDVSWGYRLMKIALGIFGLLVTSILIGLLTQIISAKVEDLRRGKSKVIEHDHTVIIGWNPSALALLGQLIEAQRSERRPCVLIYTEQDKIRIETEINQNVRDQGRTRIVVRTGSPADERMPEITAINHAKSIILLPEANGNSDPDMQILKSTLAIIGHPRRRSKLYRITAVARQPAMEELIQIAAPQEVALVPVSQFLAFLIVNTLTQPGLPSVYQEMLGFYGNEIYSLSMPEMTGLRFGEAVHHFADEVLIGVIADAKVNRKVQLNPPADYTIRLDDELLVLAEDDSGIATEPAPHHIPTDHFVNTANAQHPQHILIINTNQRLKLILDAALETLPNGSSISVLSETDDSSLQGLDGAEDSRYDMIQRHFGNPLDRESLQSTLSPELTDIILLSDQCRYDPKEADERNLVTLLHLRDLIKYRDSEVAIVTEMLDVHHRQLVEGMRSDDFVVSEDLTTAILAQVAENPDMTQILTVLLDPRHNSIVLVSVEDLVNFARIERLNFYTLTEAALRTGRIAIGYRLMRYASDRARSFGIVLNPNKALDINFAPEDRVILLCGGNA